MRKAIVSVSAALLLAVAGTAPAWAINDPVAPGDDCAASDAAIGHPGGQAATDRAEEHGADNPVDGVASTNAPGNDHTANDTSANADGVDPDCTNG